MMKSGDRGPAILEGIYGYRKKRIETHFTNLRKSYLARLQWLTFADCLKRIDSVARLTETWNEYAKMKQRVQLRRQWKAFASQLSLEFVREAADHVHRRYVRARQKVTAARCEKWRGLSQKVVQHSNTCFLRRGRMRCRWLKLRENLLSLSFIGAYGEHEQKRGTWISLVNRYRRQTVHLSLVREQERRTRERRMRASFWRDFARDLRIQLIADAMTEMLRKREKLRIKWRVFAKLLCSANVLSTSATLKNEGISEDLSFSVSASDSVELRDTKKASDTS